MSDQLRACDNQLETHQEIVNSDTEPTLAIQLHKAKFSQRKALSEYQDNRHISTILSNQIYERSEGTITARGTDGEKVTAREAWKAIGEGDPWIGSLPVQMYHSRKESYLRGYPYLISFEDGEPQVILNKILPANPDNMDRFYCNEWARPWVIAEILDATGFCTDDLVIATMKAREKENQREQIDEEKITNYLYQCAKQNVAVLTDSTFEVDLVPWSPQEVNLPHQAEYIRTQIIDYRTDYPLYDRLGHGDTIREMIDLFKQQREPKETPPDRGLSLSSALDQT